LVAAHQDKVVTIWDINKSTKRPVALLNHAGPVRSIGIEGETIFSGIDPIKIANADWMNSQHFWLKVH